MSTTNDIAWKPIAYCAGALVLGMVIGSVLIAPALKKLEEKKQSSKENSGS
ncbi:MAG: hypothetical protein AAFN81_23600 [Bacteroidota bacterium]